MMTFQYLKASKSGPFALETKRYIEDSQMVTIKI